MMRSIDLKAPDNIWFSVSRLIWDTDLASGRFILAVAECIWAFMLFLPSNTFEVGKIGRESHMLAILPEIAWGFVFLISGCIQLGIVLYEHYDTKFAKIFAFFNACLWMLLVFSILVDTYPPLAGIAGEIALMLGAVWIWIRPYILAEGLYRAGFRKSV